MTWKKLRERGEEEEEEGECYKRCPMNPRSSTMERFNQNGYLLAFKHKKNVFEFC